MAVLLDLMQFELRLLVILTQAIQQFIACGEARGTGGVGEGT